MWGVGGHQTKSKKKKVKKVAMEKEKVGDVGNKKWLIWERKTG